MNVAMRHHVFVIGPASAGLPALVFSGSSLRRRCSVAVLDGVEGAYGIAAREKISAVA
jgi:hypothetical protein